jgi:hypothetical protein
MCVFTGSAPGLSVSDTNIFARRLGPRQLLAIQLQLRVPHPVAMILPLPVSDDTVRFLDLSGCPDLFTRLDAGFPQADARPDALPVEQVGAYEATYVPTVEDFVHLDPRFRVDDEVWRRLPGYRDAAFAVFQLRPGERRLHPIGLEYAARWPEWLYFPTVHAHAGRLADEAEFDHTLYFQGFDRVWHEGRVHGAPSRRPAERRDGTQVEGTVEPARAFVADLAAADLLDPDARVLRLRVAGRRRNDDTWLVPAEDEPRLALTGYGASAWR